jgi:hypothetical protein
VLGAFLATPAGQRVLEAGAGLAAAAGAVFAFSRSRGGDLSLPRAGDASRRRTSDGVTVRIQAQGGGLESSIVIQSGGSGLVTGTDALLALGELRGSLSSGEADARASSFADAAKYIGRVAAAGGIGFSKRSFPGWPGDRR